MHINLTSDTVTRPTAAMLAAMMGAVVGDDVFRADPSINKLQEEAAALVGMEDSLFCPSGVMANQIAIALHTGRLSELICETQSHVYHYENGGYAHHAGAGIKPIDGEAGRLNAEQIEAAINPPNDWLTRTTLVVLENTCNRAGGSYYTLAQVEPIHALCRSRGLYLHLDGARLFNALCESGEAATDWGPQFDSLSFCLSKGLGAPVGSMLCGSKAFIAEARRMRKAMGGGMRQVGFLAAAGSYALANHIVRLKEDHEHAAAIGAVLAEMPYLAALRPVHTNIVIFDVRQPWDAISFIALLGEYGIQAAAFGKQTVRLVTHLDFTPAMLTQTINALQAIGEKFRSVA